VVAAQWAGVAVVAVVAAEEPRVKEAVFVGFVGQLGGVKVGEGGQLVGVTEQGGEEGLGVEVFGVGARRRRVAGGAARARRRRVAGGAARARRRRVARGAARARRRRVRGEAAQARRRGGLGVTIVVEQELVIDGVVIDAVVEVMVDVAKGDEEALLEVEALGRGRAPDVGGHFVDEVKAQARELSDLSGGPNEGLERRDTLGVGSGVKHAECLCDLRREARSGVGVWRHELSPNRGGVFNLELSSCGAY
jgi:hypothetical protein